MAVLAVKTGEYPELRLKAWTSRVLCAFLAVCLHEVCQQIPAAERDQELVLATAAMAKLADWMLLVERSPRLMSAEQVAKVDHVCWSLLGFFH